jgi:hypothetical protein
MPLVSVIVAAYRARDFIAEAVRSAMAQGVAAMEIVVAPDEPQCDGDYSFLESLDPRIRVLAPVAAASGPGPARNRALDAARGEFIALLDADDLWQPDYLSLLLPLAQRHGTAFGRTRLTDFAGNVMREVRADGAAVTFDVFAQAFASLHGVTRRLPERRWRDVLAEDVLFDMESLALSGGQAPFADAAVYQLRHRRQSLTQGQAFIDGIGAGYDRLIALVESGGTLVPPAHRAAVVDVWRAWREMDRQFTASGAADYQAFVTERLSKA